jgi:curved DNA-binding protein CbpA
VVPAVDSSFRVLGLSAGASAQEVRDAYRRLVRQHHPDTNPAARAGALGEVVAAYRTLERNGLAEVERPADAPRRHVDVYA